MRTLLPVLLLLGPVAAQDEDLPPDETSDYIGRYLERAEESLREGNYDEARLRFTKVLKRDEGNADARLGVAKTYRLRGAYDKAGAEIDVLLKAHPEDRRALVAKAQLDLLRGRLGEARDGAEKAMGKGSGEGPDVEGLAARLVAAEALARRGKREEARTALDPFLEYHRLRADSYDDANFHRDELKLKPEIARPLSHELTVVGAALRLYVQLSPLDEDFLGNANELLLLAQALDPENWDAWIERVRVTRLEREGAFAAARKARDVVTPKNPELADLWAEVGKTLLASWATGEAKEMAEKAVTVNPQQTTARAVLVQIALQDNEYAVAEENLRAGLATDPNHRDLLALKATLDLLLGNEAGFEAGMKRMLEVDPTYGEGFHIAGQVVADRQRRYDRAVELLRRGLELDPVNYEAHANLGIYLANLGREKEAKEALDKSKQLFPWSHPIRENFRTILDIVEKMETTKTEHFVIRLDPSEFPVLSLFVPQLLEDCWADMTRRYGFSPAAPVLVEVFRKADDFSVRAVGLLDYNRFAVGICFGGVMAVDSPVAMGDDGLVHWAPVTRHEFGHVMSLQLSKGQVPRWFTEGLSVLEEKPLDPGWSMDDGYEIQIHDAWHTDSIPKIGTFDAMFLTPRVGFAYYLGGLMLDYLHAVAGEEGIVKALRLYGEDAPMEEVFQKAFGLKLEEFDAKFRDYLGERIKDRHRVPNYAAVFPQLRERALTDPNDGENLLKLAWAHFFRKEYVEAGAKLQLARARVDPAHPLSRLLEARLLARAGRAERARPILEAFFASGGEDYDARLMQADFLRRDGKMQEFVAALEKAAADWPTATLPLVHLRRYYTGEGRSDDALRILEQEARLAPKAIPPRLEIVKEYVARARDAEAIKVCEECFNVNPFDPRPHLAALPLYRKAGETKKAVRSARCLVALRGEQDTDEEVAGRWLTLAEVLLEDGQRQEAGAAVKEAGKLAPDENAERRAELEKKLGQ
ncbi:MAG TPA: tetratricopeptide repeat protein [Planctomycetota bacterium]|nr:tetratricopeptide repeat protein [Planctomycetota bacterium]